jgi:hypothetical protein
VLVVEELEVVDEVLLLDVVDVEVLVDVEEVLVLEDVDVLEELLVVEDVEVEDVVDELLEVDEDEEVVELVLVLVEVEVLLLVVVVVHAVFGVFTHPLAGLHESSVHMSLSLQSRRPPSHSPWLLQVSMVHAFESEGHASDGDRRVNAKFMLCWGIVVQTFPSSQSASRVPHW